MELYHYTLSVDKRNFTFLLLILAQGSICSDALKTSMIFATTRAPLQSTYCSLIELYVVNEECTHLHHNTSGFGGLEVAYWPLVPKFAGSNPAEAVGFFRAKKSSSRLPSEGK